MRFLFLHRAVPLEQNMSYNATSFFEYMNTNADIMYAYGASAAIRHDGYCVPYG